uniref:Uncharacterized protein n=1 Tax=Panagrolaimus davidi TaxID=227884 RepID=A0A914P871_9BILA
MNSTEIVIPILMRWKVSKEEIRLKLQRQTKLYKMVPLFPGVKYGLVIERTDQNEIFVSLSFEIEQSKDIKTKFKISFIPENVFFQVRTYGRVFKYDFHRWGDTSCTIEEFFDDGNICEIFNASILFNLEKLRQHCFDSTMFWFYI